jgi:hypothetical protein
VEHLILKVLLLTVAWHQSRGMAESSQDLIMTLFRQHWTFKSRKKGKKKQATFSCVPNGKDNQATIWFWFCLLDSTCFTFIHSIAQWLESEWCSLIFLPKLSRGVWAMIAVFLAYCTLQAPSTWVLLLCR